MIGRFTFTQTVVTHSPQLPVDIILLNVREGSQRLHASRRVFETMAREGMTTSVIHHITFEKGTPR